MSNQLARVDSEGVPKIVQSMTLFSCMLVLSVDLFDGSRRWLSMDAFTPNHPKGKAAEYEKEIYDTTFENVESFINKNIRNVLSVPPSEKTLAHFENRDQFFNNIFADSNNYGVNIQ